MEAQLDKPYLLKKSHESQPEVQTFEIKKNFQISVSLLLNDIQNFADLYRTFRDTHFEFFDLEEQRSDIARSNSPTPSRLRSRSRQECSSPSVVSHGGITSKGGYEDVKSEEITVPVDPSLAQAFESLATIDEYRVTNDALLLDKLMQQDFSEASRSSITQTKSTPVDDQRLQTGLSKIHEEQSSLKSSLSRVEEDFLQNASGSSKNRILICSKLQSLETINE